MKRVLAAFSLLALSSVEFMGVTAATVAPAQAVVVVRRAPVARAAVVRRPVVRAPVRRGVVVVH